ncbi:hypothetical protein [Acinetobacter baumannii]|uniref:hypothetical protein n=1 Tax=Acinetobacter baumannii TaxID=470 RepID=UPI00256B05A8|nr:hypothetical protein [Acinetobacter baumannii]EKT8141404.1 hypothetical protein [Acinetobacter baumannii]EKU7083945.1 hypothetical protein [Acinetobacter baumannii]EKV1039782.1 hypothetical protein [Acinetobacter baumannii]EKV1043509.1 hypothetical protein [Acinetobacter baumannii]EKV1918627.1 hypothetical protein [Acinetobacter baumannii]
MDKNMSFVEWCANNGKIPYSLGLEDAYSAGQHSMQAKVEELQNLYTQQGINMLKLQKRVDAAERQLQLVQQCIEESSYTKWPSSVRLIQVSDLEQALKGEGQ